MEPLKVGKKVAWLVKQWVAMKELQLVGRRAGMLEQM
jgi:hypothetical protein